MLKLNKRYGMATGERLACCLMAGAALVSALTTSPALARKEAKYGVVTDFSGTNDQETPFGAFAQGQNGQLYGALFINDTMIYTPRAGGPKVEWWQDSTGNVCGYAMTLGPDGALYGTCTEYQYNDNSSGIVFRFDPTMKKNNFSVLYSFPQIGGGSVYPSPLTLGPDGNFYGTTRNDEVNEGTVFQISPTGAFATIHTFQGGSDDGAYPSSGGTYVGNAIGLTLGSDGNLYGTTNSGGVNSAGTVYQVTTSGAVTVLYSFPENNCPCTGVTEANGNFYGQTNVGGTSDEGTIYQLTPDGTYTTIHNFDASADSAEYPAFPLTLGSDGNLYSASPSFTGGYGPESLYRITPAGTYTDLYNGFAVPAGSGCSQPTLGCFVQSPLYQSTDGQFYGATLWGGNEGNGEAFRLKIRGAEAFVRPSVRAAKPGQWIGMLGQGFAKAKNVSFGGKTAAFRVVSDTWLEARVPLDATTGRIEVKTAAGELRSNSDFSPLH